MKRRKSQGFTLIELMMTVTIMMALLILAAPGMGAWRLSSRQYELTNHIVNMGKRAASRARERGEAHILRLRTVNGRFNIKILQGMTRRCRQTRWNSVDPVTLPFLADELGFNQHSRDGESEALRVTFQLYDAAGNALGAADPNADICYQPNGNTYIDMLAAPPMTRQTMHAEAHISRTGGSAQRTRVVAFPPAGVPRPRL